MIWESRYWKLPLVEMAKRLAILKTTKAPSERQLAQLEGDIFIGFYSIRKLTEADAKLTDSTKALMIDLSWHPNKRKVIRRLSNQLELFYDFRQENHELRSIWFVSSQIIHSFVFLPALEEQSGVSGIFFTSDKDKDKSLYFMKISDIIYLFDRVGNDDPIEIIWSRNPNTGEEIFSAR